MSEEYMGRDEAAKMLRELEEQCDSLRAGLRVRVEDTDRLRRERDEYWEMAEGLKERVAELEAEEPQGDPIEALEERWKGARKATRCEAGDVVIAWESEDSYSVTRRRKGGRLHTYQRILASAPEPEPWRELADALRAHTGEPDPDETARMLYEYGVRMASDEEF